MTNLRTKNFSIGETATLCGVSRKQLRHWEERGYIPKPERVLCGERSYRKFGKHEFDIIMRIAGYLKMGYTLSAAAKKAAEHTEKKEGRKLERAIKLDLDLNIYKDYAKRIADLIYIKVHRDYWRKDYKPVLIRMISNLRTSYELDRPLHYSRNAHYYPKRGIGYRVLTGLIDTMIEEKLIEQQNGYYDENFGGKQSRMWASEDLVSLFIVIHPEDVVKEPPERLVELRDRNSKDIIDNNNEINSMVNQLEDYGRMMLNHKVEMHISNETELSDKSKEQIVNLISIYRYSYISILYPTISSTMPYDLVSYGNSITTIKNNIGYDIGLSMRYRWLHRVFSDTFNLGGRYYGAPWQFISSELRSHIEIDDEPTIELDYSGLHVRMLYHLEGIDYNGDPYTFGKPEWRPLYKLVALIMINCRNKRYSTNAIKKCFRDNGFGRSFSTDMFDKNVIKQMVADFESLHQPIKDYFCSDIGIKLQYIDSEITSYILHYFIDKDVPILPVHDSYVVPEKYGDELYHVMIEAYEYHLGFEPVIK